MEQHAIPQQISSYEFKLVGDMTLKQFLKAAAGIVVAAMLNSSKLIFFLKYPLMLIFAGGGLMIAFVPFQDRPLETWLIAFLRSIYSPTIYTYKKMPDESWVSLMDKRTIVDTTIQVEDEVAAPVKNRDRVKEFIESLPSVKMGNSRPAVEKTEEEKSINNEQLIINNEKLGAEVVKTETKEKVEAEVKEEDWRETKADLDLKTEKLGATAAAVFGEIPMPNKPDVPNIVVGMVTNKEGKIVEGAIVEIQDEKGNPTRVLKTNPLGQFKTTAALANGKYLIITEKEEMNFDRVNIELKGEIVEPIKIQAII
jgi:hypothetical protein